MSEQPPATQTTMRKARKQVTRKKGGPALQREEGGGDYNIWYHKYVGHRRERWEDREPAETRCHILTDAGWTTGEANREPYFCLYFAKGCCSLGHDCQYLHRIPNEADEKRTPLGTDCFGRDRFSQHRDDMGGVGSFNKECKTLYLSGLKNIEGYDVEEATIKNFAEWGELEYVRVFKEKCYGFVKYKLRTSAEFAKEAMTGQALDHEEVLNVRWATDDPNPAAQKRNDLARREQFIGALEKQGLATIPLPFNYPKDYVPQMPQMPQMFAGTYPPMQQLPDGNQDPNANGNVSQVAAQGEGETGTSTATGEQQQPGTEGGDANAAQQYQYDPNYYNYYYQYWNSYYESQGQQQQQTGDEYAPDYENVERERKRVKRGGTGPFDYWDYIYKFDPQYSDQQLQRTRVFSKHLTDVCDVYPDTDAQYSAEGGQAPAYDYYNQQASNYNYYNQQATTTATQATTQEAGSDQPSSDTVTPTADSNSNSNNDS